MDECTSLQVDPHEAAVLRQLPPAHRRRRRRQHGRRAVGGRPRRLRLPHGGQPVCCRRRRRPRLADKEALLWKERELLYYQAVISTA